MLTKSSSAGSTQTSTRAPSSQNGSVDTLEIKNKIKNYKQEMCELLMKLKNNGYNITITASSMDEGGEFLHIEYVKVYEDRGAL